jgi:hypothetical protein
MGPVPLKAAFATYSYLNEGMDLSRAGIKAGSAAVTVIELSSKRHE